MQREVGRVQWPLLNWCFHYEYGDDFDKYPECKECAQRNDCKKLKEALKNGRENIYEYKRSS